MSPTVPEAAPRSRRPHGLAPLRRVALATALLAALAAAPAWRPATATDPEPQPEPTRQTMHRVFDALAALLPAAIADSDAEWERRPEAVRGAIDALAAASEQLAAHGVHGDASFRFLAGSLASESRMLARQLERGRYAGAAYFTERVVETCIACHVRLPSQGAGDFERALLERVDRSALSPFAKANLEMAARQFDAALQSQEALFRDPDASLAPLELAQSLASYLIVSLRVKRDPARASRGLALLAERTDLSAQLELNLPLWQQALAALGPALHEPPSLERAQQILSAGSALNEFPLDGAEQVHAVIASSVLFRYLDERAPEGPELAQTLYLLSRTEAFTRRSFDVSEGASYLEQAIDAAPHSAIAERAYARLELQTLLQYSGPEGIELPVEVEAWLKELRERSSTRPRPAQEPLKDVAAAAP